MTKPSCSHFLTKPSTVRTDTGIFQQPPSTFVYKLCDHTVRANFVLPSLESSVTITFISGDVLSPSHMPSAGIREV